MLSTASVTHATETCKFYITLTDTCGSPYSGYYDVEIEILASGSPVGTAVCQNVTTGGGCFTFIYNIGPLVSDPVYTIIVIAAERHGGGCYLLLNKSYGPSTYFDYLLSCTSNPFPITITI